MKNRVLVALGVTNILLAAGLAMLWVDEQGQLRNVHWDRPMPVQSDYMQMLPLLSQRDVSARTDTFLVLLERPLFSSTRRPPPPPAPPAPPAPPDTLANAQVLGIFQADGMTGIIAKIDGKSRRIRINEVVSGWQLLSVHERGAVFVNSGQTRELVLVRAKVGVGSAVSAPATSLPFPQSPISNSVQNSQVEQPSTGATQPSTVPSTQVTPNEPAAETVPTRRRPRFGP